MTEPEPDEFALELALAEDREPPRSAGLAPAARELEAYRGWWAAHRPPLPAARPARRWGWVGVGLVLVAAAVLALAIRPSPPPFVARGAPAVDVSIARDGHPVEAGSALRADDRLGVAMVVGRGSVVSVTALQDDGEVSLLVVGAPAPDGTFRVPGIALDGYGGREWLVVDADDEPPTPEALEARVRALLPDPTVHAGPRRWVIEITRGRASP